MTKRKADDEPRLKARPGEGTHKKKRGTNAGGNVAEARSRGIDTGSAARAALVDIDKPLTTLQRNFVKLWASGETLLSASIKAGYADGGTYAYRMARMPNILKLYNEEKAAYESASNMSRKRVIDGLLEAIADAKLLEEPSSQIAGWREIGKLCGYFEPVKVQHTVTHEGTIVVDRLNKMDDAALLAFIAEQASVISAATPLLPAPGDYDIEDVDPR